MQNIFFSPGPWPLRQPPEAQILTSATSIGSQILAEDTSFHMKYCLLAKMKIWKLPRVFNWPKSPGSLGLINYTARHIYLSQSIARNLQLCFHFLDALLHLLRSDEHRLHQFLGLTIGVWHLVLIGQKLAFVLKIKSDFFVKTMLHSIQS